MSGPAYALNLGNGLYMDSEGNLLPGAPSNVPLYQAPFTLPIDPKKISDAFSSVNSALAGINKEGFLHERWGKVAEIDKILDLLSGVGKLAGFLAPAAALFSFAVDAAKLLGFLKEGPSPLETLVKQRFDQLDSEVTAIQQLIQFHDLRDGRLDIVNLVAQVKTYVAQLAQANPSIPQLENDRSALIGAVNIHINGFAKLLDHQTWLTDFKRGDHTLVWPMIAAFLFTVPGSANWPHLDASATDILPAPLPTDGMNFDHRLMVPLAAYAAESFLVCLRGISPEYRTSGDFRDKLMDFAKSLDDLARLMRDQVLARTIYRPEHFGGAVVIYESEVAYSAPFGLGTPQIKSPCSRWPVGAIDLRYHDDKYFADFIRQLTLNEAIGYPGPMKFGAMDFGWIPPAILEWEEFRGIYKITNPEECAAAANAQSEKDYAGLITVSGYPELLRLHTLFRNEATDPPKSQTVHPTTPTLYRNPLSSTMVTVESNPVHFTGEIIKATARREPQECVDKVEVWTQPINRARPVQYRVKLRTLNSQISKDSWQEPAYSDYQRVDYEGDPENPGFLRLALSTAFLEVANHELISEWSSSPHDPNHLSGSVDMLADTFDWWIPVQQPFSVMKPFNDTLVALRSNGWSGSPIAPQPLPTTEPMLNLTDEVISSNETGQRFKNYIPELFWKPGKQDWDGQHREVRREIVHIEYELEWIADRLHFSIKNQPSNRNYVVFLVIEEKMQYTGNVLHTAVALPVNGLLTYVPQTFFDDEFAAHARTAAVIAGLIAKQIPSAPGPTDPVIGWVRPGDLATRAGVNRILDLANEHQPALLREIVAQVTQRDQLGADEIP